jgi:competence protein ComEC
LDIVVLSHPHPDHYGGLHAVLAAVSVGELWDTGQSSAEAHMEHTSSAAARVVSDAETRGVRIRDPAQLCGRPRTFAGAVIEVLWPCPRYDPDYDPNDNSLVLRIAYGAHSFLFTGDIEAHAEAALTAGAVPLRADVLKVPHHGSRTSSSEALLHAVSPALAVISAGAVNRFGHPHVDVTDRLQSAVPHVIDIGRSGGTVVTSDGKQLRYRTWAGGVDTTVHRKSARPALQTDTSRRCAPLHMAPETLKRAPADDASASTLNGVAQSK